MKNKSIAYARYLQLFAHATYVILGYFFFLAMKRPLFYYPLLGIFLFFAFILSTKLANALYGDEEDPYSATPLIMAGTLMLNLESINFFGYAVAGLLGVFSRSFLRTKTRHIFNPGFFGAFALCMLFPFLGVPARNFWSPDPRFICTIILLGTLVVYKAKRLPVSYGYVITFALASAAATAGLRAFGIGLNGIEFAPTFFWPSTLLAPSSLIFTFHVISDPKTSPSTLKGQIAFGVCIALLDLALKLAVVIPSEMISYMAVQAVWALLSTRRAPSSEAGICAPKAFAV